MTTERCTCGCRKVRFHPPKRWFPTSNTEGFSLLEAVFSIGLAALVLTTSLRVGISMLQGTNQWFRELEVSAMSTSLQRVFAQDIHRAAGASIVYGQLNLNMLDGTSFRYAVNANGQLVRMQTGGGTAVIAEGVAKLDVEIQPMSVTCYVLYRSGRNEEFIFTIPAVLGG